MKDSTSKKKFNRNSITINVNSNYTLNAFNEFKYDAKKTELTHDALQVLLNSANPLRTEYGFNDNDFELIAQFVAKQNQLINEMSYFLENCKEYKEAIQ
jgi:uncharacterized protein YozE (UPF0346 family)